MYIVLLKRKGEAVSCKLQHRIEWKIVMNFCHIIFFVTMKCGENLIKLYLSLLF